MIQKYDDILGLEYYGEDLTKVQTPDLINEFLEDFDRNIRAIAVAKELRERSITTYATTEQELKKELDKYVDLMFVKMNEMSLPEGKAYIDCVTDLKYYIFEGKIVTISKIDNKYVTYEVEVPTEHTWLRIVQDSHRSELANYEKRKNKDVWNNLSREEKLQVLDEGYLNLRVEKVINIVESLDDDGVFKETTEKLKKQFDV